MQSTLKCKSKTHSGVLPQLRTLEVLVDASDSSSGPESPGKVKTGTTKAGSPCADQTGFQHGRGERPQGSSPSPQREENSGVTRVFVLSKDGTPLMPCYAARARELLKKRKAVVVRRYPFVIRLKHNPNQPATQPVAIKLDPGAKTTGIALVRLTSSAQIVLHLSELTHRSAYIKESLAQRRSFRRNRRVRKTRYRAPRFNNRSRTEGWLPPSLQASLQTGKSAGVHLGRVAIRATRKFDIQTITTTIQGIGHKHCRLIQRADGYNYYNNKTAIPPTAKQWVSSADFI